MRQISIYDNQFKIASYNIDEWADGYIITMGRNEHTTWAFPPYSEISSHHLSIRKSGDKLYLRDENSYNGTFVNGERLTHAVCMRSGVTYQVGRLRLFYEGDSCSEPTEHVSCDFVFPEPYGFALMDPTVQPTASAKILHTAVAPPQYNASTEATPATAIVLPTQQQDIFVPASTNAKPVTACKAPIRKEKSKAQTLENEKSEYKKTINELSTRERNKLSRYSATVCIFFIASFGIILFLCKIINPPPPSPSFDYVTIAEDLPVAKRLKVKELSSKVSLAAPTPANFISSSSVSNISAVSVDIPTENSQVEIGIDGIGTGMGDMMGLGMGVDGSTGSGMGASQEIESAFVGEFWDLKRKKNKDESEYYPHAKSSDVLNLLSKFYNENWSQREFSPFLKSSVKLYTTCFLMPHASDLEATNAYDPTGEQGLEKSRWVVIYRASVQAPKTGEFRFVAAADSVMGVRFNKKNVLKVGLHDLESASWGKINTYNGKNPTYHYRSCRIWNTLCNGFTAGDSFHVKKGEWYDMEVLISEIGGGYFGFCLLIDEIMNGESTSTEKILGIDKYTANPSDAACQQPVEQAFRVRENYLSSEQGGSEDIKRPSPKRRPIYTFKLVPITCNNTTNFTKETTELPVFQLFRTQLVEPDIDEIYDNLKYPDAQQKVDPPYDKDSLVWPARRINGGKSSR